MPIELSPALEGIILPALPQDPLHLMILSLQNSTKHKLIWQLVSHSYPLLQVIHQNLPIYAATQVGAPVVVDAARADLYKMKVIMAHADTDKLLLLQVFFSSKRLITIQRCSTFLVPTSYECAFSFNLDRYCPCSDRNNPDLGRNYSSLDNTCPDMLAQNLFNSCLFYMRLVNL